MNLFYSKIKSPKVLIFVSFVVLHLLLFNVNTAEWGDSYRILRAAEYIKQGSYPTDEKRLPLFALVLASSPKGVDQVLWGRGVMFVFSIAAFFIFSKLCDLFLENNFRGKILALLMFCLNPVWLYWSLRIMADIPFATIVLLVLYLYTKWQSNKQLDTIHVVILGILIGMVCLTRFEGYLLFGALGLGILITNKRDLWKPATFKKLFYYCISFFVVILPYIYVNNPFVSKYFEEPAGRVYDLKMVLIYIISLLFLFGFTQAFSFVLKTPKAIFAFFKKNTAITAFVMAELLLVLLWPAAVPRLFVPIIPLLIIPLALSIVDFFENSENSRRNVYLIAVFIGVFLVGQWLFRLPFLVSTKYLFVAVLFIQAIISYFIITKRFRGFLVSLTFSMLLWSFAAIWVHKDIFAVVQQAAEYTSNNLQGVVGYNDVSSVSDWYLNQKGENDVNGVYFSYGKKEDINYEEISRFDYILMTNEHNTDTTLDIEKRDYLEEIKEFKRVINGKEFWTKVIRVQARKVF